MSERKVLNKYYPPDFDPSKIPRLRLPKTRQYTVRIMTPCNMRCNTCGDYIAKAKKFNARKETVEEESYLGLKIFRFYFKCPTCMAEITFKTDPKTCDYELEHGATRNFQALRLAEQQAEREAQEKEEEEKLNPMKMLENRTKASRREMEELEALEELKDMSERKILVDHSEILERKRKEAEEAVKKQEEEDEAFVRRIMAQRQQATSSHYIDGDESDEEVIEDEQLTGEELTKLTNSQPILKKETVDSNFPDLSEPSQSREKPSLKRKLINLVKIKEPEKKIKPEHPIEAAKVEGTKISTPETALSNIPKLGGLLCSYSDSEESGNDS